MSWLVDIIIALGVIQIFLSNVIFLSILLLEKSAISISNHTLFALQVRTDCSAEKTSHQKVDVEQ